MHTLSLAVVPHAFPNLCLPWSFARPVCLFFVLGCYGASVPRNAEPNCKWHVMTGCSTNNVADTKFLARGAVALVVQHENWLQNTETSWRTDRLLFGVFWAKVPSFYIHVCFHGAALRSGILTWSPHGPSLGFTFDEFEGITECCRQGCEWRGAIREEGGHGTSAALACIRASAETPGCCSAMQNVKPTYPSN